MKLLSSLVIILTVQVQLFGQTARIEFTAPGTYPEGIVYDAIGDQFYVSSVRLGQIGKVDANGRYTAFFGDSTLKSTFGMKIDAVRKLLWICAGDPNYSKYRDSVTYKKMIRVLAINLSSGKKVYDIDLANLFVGKHFPNDLTIDQSGNVYITDSYSPVIYKIDVDGRASLFAQSEWFGSVGVGLNGIAWHPGGYILVANNGNGALLKVDLADPKRISKVMIKQFFPGADGLLLDDQQRLYLVQNKGVNKVFQLSSSDNWLHAAVNGVTESKAMFAYPSTATMRKQQVWVMNAKLNELSDSTSVISDKFTMQQAIFVPVK